MLSHGDEIGRTQSGNNNAYCQDNEISWVDWNLGPRERELLRFTVKALEIRRSNPVLRRRSFFGGRAMASGVKDVTWLRPDGSEMRDEDWHEGENRILGMLIHGQATDEMDDRGRPIHGATLCLLLNAGERSKLFTLPKLVSVGTWEEILHTQRTEPRDIRGQAVNLVAHSLVLLRYREIR
jgi:glycogen operon protein